MKRSGFTLIELLVVIAIIAILAAILFPVFAQAKLAAKKTQALSGVKQLTLSILMYENDYDDLFPEGFQGTDWTGMDLWEQRVQPYVKNIGIFASPADSFGLQTPLVGTWAGVGVSFAANGLYGNWCCAPDWNSGDQLRGPMGVGIDTYGNGQRDEGQGWLMAAELNDTQVTQPAGSILLTEKHGDDVDKWDLADNSNNFNDRGNFSAFGMGGDLLGNDCDGIGWGPQKVPDATRAAGGFDIGPNGAVSASYSNQAVFSFVDGHAKGMVPSATDPDPVNQPQNNLWDALR
jgi:prepilin-type N-terminal cleavage/methylation domain-containing protein